MATLKKNRKREEFWNVVTQGTGAVLSVAAFTLLVLSSAIKGSAKYVEAFYLIP